MRLSPLYPDWTVEPSRRGSGEPGPAPDIEALASAYRTIADAFVYPDHLDSDAYLDRARTEVVPAIGAYIDSDAAVRLSSFLDAYETLSVDEFIPTLELEPACPPYLGHHEFEAPSTCRDISNADRNQYMVELNAIYEHFGFELDSELPDFLPAMVEFCWLTLPERDDDVRAEFVSGMVTLLPGMQQAFESADSQYAELLSVLQQILAYDSSLADCVDTEAAETDDTQRDDDVNGPSLDILDSAENEGDVWERSSGSAAKLDPERNRMANPETSGGDN